MKNKMALPVSLGVAALALASQNASATCADIGAAFGAAGGLPSVTAIVLAKNNGGFGLPSWIAAVDETGKVCGIVNTSGQAGTANIGNSSWLGSRVIAAQKANTANAFSLNNFSISTSNLYGLVLPGGSLFGLQHSNPIDASNAYLGAPETYGTGLDPLVNKRIGGVNVFGGGLALYNSAGVKVGAIGVSGDTSCTDHANAWRIRALLGLDHVPGGFVSNYAPAPAFAVKGDEMIIKLTGATTDIQNTFKQVGCPNNPPEGAATGVILEP